MITNLATPGVYIDEINAFPNSVVEVATAVPAFIGYTPQATYEGQSYIMKPTKVTSMQEFNAIFAFPTPSTPGAAAPKQYSPSYYIVKQKAAPEKGDYYTVNGDIYTIEPDPNTIYYLYNSVQLYFANGGGEAYIVSLGSYGAGSGAGKDPGALIQNANLSVKDMQTGLQALKKFPDVTMYIVPEATLLTSGDNLTIMQDMLAQAGAMQTAMTIFDIIGGQDPDPISWPDDITNFRNSTGNNDLKYGSAYYPFLNTTIVTSDLVDYTNINGGDTTVLNDILNPPTAPNSSAASILSSIQSGSSDLTVSQNNQALIIASPTYKFIMGIIQAKMNIMPPSGIMAGVWSLTDSTEGVWYAPANKTPMGVTSTTLQIDDTEQEGLNVDAVSGKSVNAIRFFNGQGVLVWGARTLDGNSQDWRYINVRRTVTMIEQSAKLALRAYVFAPNTSNTWATIKSMLENFLTNTWKQGALAGAKASDAFSVEIGLGTTMTSQDILDGYLRVAIKIAVSHPAEFIVLQVQQEQQKS
ncbi:MAG: phage tail sheath C-terminal domain-containing protein [Bacteroidota bacterium]